MLKYTLNLYALLFTTFALLFEEFDCPSKGFQKFGSYGDHNIPRSITDTKNFLQLARLGEKWLFHVQKRDILMVM